MINITHGKRQGNQPAHHARHRYCSTIASGFVNRRHRIIYFTSHHKPRACSFKVPSHNNGALIPYFQRCSGGETALESTNRKRHGRGINQAVRWFTTPRSGQGGGRPQHDDLDAPTQIKLVWCARGTLNLIQVLNTFVEGVDAFQSIARTSERTPGGLLSCLIANPLDCNRGTNTNTPFFLDADAGKGVARPSRGSRVGARRRRVVFKIQTHGAVAAVEGPCF